VCRTDARTAIVGTNSISQGKSRVAALDYITHNGGHIHEAISTQPWSGEANVHVSIVNWSKIEPVSYYLDNHPVSQINSSLTTTVDSSKAVRLLANKNISFQGVIPVGKGFYQLVRDFILKVSKRKNGSKMILRIKRF